VSAFAELVYRVSAKSRTDRVGHGVNPVLVFQHGAVAADIRVRLAG